MWVQSGMVSVEDELAISIKITDAFYPLTIQCHFSSLFCVQIEPKVIHWNSVHKSKRLETTKCPAIREYLKKLWHIYIMKYYVKIFVVNRCSKKREKCCYVLMGKKSKVLERIVRQTHDRDSAQEGGHHMFIWENPYYIYRFIVL